jgi:hypothetical protein
MTARIPIETLRTILGVAAGVEHLHEDELAAMRSGFVAAGLADQIVPDVREEAGGGYLVEWHQLAPPGFDPRQVTYERWRPGPHGPETTHR